MLYCFYFSDTEAFEACFRLLHDDDDDDEVPTCLTKLREYVALLYATSDCLCDKNEVITATYFLWRPVNYSLADESSTYPVCP